AVIGGAAAARTLQLDLAAHGVRRYALAGWIASDPSAGGRQPPLGSLREIDEIVAREQIDLLLVAPDVPRLAAFDALIDLTDASAVRACELSAFYEKAFGHIPVSEINSAWFQYFMHPDYRQRQSLKRAFDIIASLVLGLAVLPLLLIAALLIRLDGGPSLYRQSRIGRKGRPFVMLKLRTMSGWPSAQGARWCAVDDPRITRFGRWLRAMHADELPQLYNVLRGDMSLVGPRPEQPAIVSMLESNLDYYSRRHLTRPGITGWAQIRCGYARSEDESAWKLCHDLYYLKHQSLLLDVRILARTVATIVSHTLEAHRLRKTEPALLDALPAEARRARGRGLAALTRSAPGPDASRSVVVVTGDPRGAPTIDDALSTATAE
ncbi:MAG TPA: sugar transferase, partial [Solirubrobacteraceae bacterium]|nr:sugar transferase [Solirubrobacteraceae bacterium]